MRAGTATSEAASSRTFRIDCADIRRTDWASPQGFGEIGPGDVLLGIRRFGLSANNITYAAKGRDLFWKFFPSTDAEWFNLPVWGFADVAVSGHPFVRAGERFYGCFPAASHLLMRSVENAEGGITATEPHRAALPAIYRFYYRVATDPGYAADRENQQALLRPVFRTAFLLHDHLVESAFFGAKQVVLGSASSKTALVLAFLLKCKNPGVTVIGLTASRNSGFVTRTALFDQVLSYEDAGFLDLAPTAYVDMSGDSGVRKMMHRHLGDFLVHDSRVGATHWQELGEEAFPGVLPTTFSVAEQMKRRTADWGPEELQRQVAEDWTSFLRASVNWLSLDVGHGEAAMSRAYANLVAGAADPSRGHVITF